MTTSSLPTDTYYRGYRLSQVRAGTPTETIHVRYPGDSTLLAAVPTLDQAKKVVDEYHNAR